MILMSKSSLVSVTVKVLLIKSFFFSSHSYLSERRRGRPRNAQAKSDEATLYRARARYYAKQQLRGSEKKRCVGRPRKLSGEPSPVKPARQLTVIKKKPLPLVEKEKKTTVVMQHTMLLVSYNFNIKGIILILGE